MARKIKEVSSAVIDWFCPKCGKDVSMEDEKCSHCGAKFVPIGSISEEEARLQKLQDDIKEATAKKKEVKKEKAEKKKEAAIEVEKPKRGKMKEVASKTGSPRPGTRKAFVFEALTTEGLNYDTFTPLFAKEFELDDEEAVKAIKMIIYQFKRDDFSIVEEGGIWKLEQK